MISDTHFQKLIELLETTFWFCHKKFRICTVSESKQSSFNHFSAATQKQRRFDWRQEVCEPS